MALHWSPAARSRRPVTGLASSIAVRNAGLVRAAAWSARWSALGVGVIYLDSVATFQNIVDMVDMADSTVEKCCLGMADKWRTGRLNCGLNGGDCPRLWPRSRVASRRREWPPCPPCPPCPRFLENYLAIYPDRRSPTITQRFCVASAQASSHPLTHR